MLNKEAKLVNITPILLGLIGGFEWVIYIELYIAIVNVDRKPTNKTGTHHPVVIESLL